MTMAFTQHDSESTPQQHTGWRRPAASSYGPPSSSTLATTSTPRKPRTVRSRRSTYKHFTRNKTIGKKSKTRRPRAPTLTATWRHPRSPLQPCRPSSLIADPWATNVGRLVHTNAAPRPSGPQAHAEVDLRGLRLLAPAPGTGLEHSTAEDTSLRTQLARQAAYISWLEDENIHLRAKLEGSSTR